MGVGATFWPAHSFIRLDKITLCSSFFSFFGPCESGKRALWAILESDIEIINKAKRSEKNKVHIVNPLTHHNPRLVNQRGLFLKVPVDIDLESWIKKARKKEWVTMYKIEYSDSIRNDVLSALNNMNINHLPLFPDLVGSSLYSNYQLTSEPYLEESREKLWGEE